MEQQGGGSRRSRGNAGLGGWATGLAMRAPALTHPDVMAEYVPAARLEVAEKVIVGGVHGDEHVHDVDDVDRE